MRRSLTAWVCPILPVVIPRSKFKLSSDKQHKLLVDIMGRYPPPLQEIERDDSRTEPKSCLDRIIEFAQDFPQWSTVAVDLIPMQSSYVYSFVLSLMSSFLRRSLPPNLVSCPTFIQERGRRPQLRPRTLLRRFRLCACEACQFRHQGLFNLH